MSDILFFAMVVGIFGLLVGVVERMDRARAPLFTIDRHRQWREVGA